MLPEVKEFNNWGVGLEAYQHIFPCITNNILGTRGDSAKVLILENHYLNHLWWYAILIYSVFFDK